jgi:hypothetical protein
VCKNLNLCVESTICAKLPHYIPQVLPHRKSQMNLLLSKLKEIERAIEIDRAREIDRV